MSLVDDILKQPQRTRDTLFSLLVVVTILVAGVVWFSSFQRNVYALLNPDPEDQQRFFAQADRSLPLRATISGFFGSLRASIYGILDFENTGSGVIPTPSDGQDVRTLPVAEPRIAVPPDSTPNR